MRRDLSATERTELELVRVFTSQPLERIQEIVVRLLSRVLRSPTEGETFSFLVVREGIGQTVAVNETSAESILGDLERGGVRAFWVRKQSRGRDRAIEFYSQFAEHNPPPGSVKRRRRLQGLAAPDPYHGYRFDLAWDASGEESQIRSESLQAGLEDILRAAGGVVAFCGRASEATVVLGMSEEQRRRGLAQALFDGSWLNTVAVEGADSEYLFKLGLAPVGEVTREAFVGRSEVSVRVDLPRVKPPVRAPSDGPRFSFVTSESVMRALGGEALLCRVLLADARRLPTSGGWLVDVDLESASSAWFVKQLLWPVPSRAWEPWSLCGFVAGDAATWFLAEKREKAFFMTLAARDEVGDSLEGGELPICLEFLTGASIDAPRAATGLLRDWSARSGHAIHLEEGESACVIGSLLPSAADRVTAVADLGLWLRERVNQVRGSFAVSIGRSTEEERQVRLRSLGPLGLSMDF